MRLPPRLKPVARKREAARTATAITPSGCCAQICTPLGCICAYENPFC